MAAVGQAALGQALHIEERHIEEKLPGCGNDKDGCAHAEFRYVEVADGPAGARDRINAEIREYLVARPRDDKKFTPEEYAKNFIQSYEKVRAEAKDAVEQRWALSKSVKVLRDTSPVFSVECESWSYTGGAHGLGGKTYLNFDPVSGEKITLAAILNEGAMANLRAVAERHFRAERKLAADADLTEAGFTFPDGRFALNDNYGIGTNALVFYYAPYEIAPYAMGATEVRVPFEEIRDLLKEGFR